METMTMQLCEYPGYSVCTDGTIFHNGIAVTPHPNGRGYNKVFLHNSDGDRKSRPIHRLVAETFIPNPLNLPVVNHINGDKLDNRVENLEWVTHQENTRHFFDNNSVQTKPVAKVNPHTGKIKEVFSSIRIAAKCYGYDYRTFYDAVKRGCLYRGYLWKHCTLQITLSE